MTANNDLTIRRVTEEDVEALIELRLEALRNHPVAFSADYEKERDRSLPDWKKRIARSVIFVAWDGDSAAGMATFLRGASSKTSYHGNIFGVYVRPGYRGHGLGGRLVDRCVQWARDNDIPMVYIAAAATNTAAIRCYTRCGFSVYGLQPMAVKVDGIYYDELLMAQELQTANS